MRPVDQTQFGVPGGNCFSAAVASLLELPLEDVPYFMGVENWHGAFAAWLKPRRLYAIHMRAETPGWRPTGLHLIGGQSPRGSHEVVGRDGEMVHDPHPSRAGLVSVEDFTVLVPIDPARAQRRP